MTADERLIDVAGRSAPQIELPPASPSTPPKPTSFRGRLFGRFADYARRYLTASVEHRLTAALTELGAVRQQLVAAEVRAERLDARTERMEGVLAQLSETSSVQIAQQNAIARDLGALPALFGPRLDELEIKLRPMIVFDDVSYAIRLRDGYAMVPRDQPDFAVMVANATSGGLEPGTRRVLQALLKPGMTAADVGANVGLLSLACAVAVGPTGRVLAFEPEAGPRRQLEKTRHLNGLRWLELYDCAVGAAEERRTFHISPVIGHSSLYQLPADEEGRGEDVEVQVRCLDDLLNGAPLDVVKMDVEGAELDVLAGMQQLLSQNKDLAIVAEYGPSHLSRIGVTPQAWFEAFETAGFLAFEIVEPTGLCRPASVAGLGDVDSVNIAFVRRSGQARRRLPQ